MRTMNTAGLREARTAIGTATAALEAGNEATAKRALAMAGKCVGLGGVPKVASLSLALDLVRASYMARLDRVNEERRLFGLGPLLGMGV